MPDNRAKGIALSFSRPFWEPQRGLCVWQLLPAPTLYCGNADAKDPTAVSMAVFIRQI